MDLVEALHFLGIVLWLGSTLVVSRMLAVHATAEPGAHATLSALERRTQLFAGLPGMLLTLGTGVSLLLQDPRTYMKQGWMHGKLTLILALLVLEGLLFVRIRAFAKEPGKRSAGMGIHIGAALCLIGILGLVKVLGRVP